MKILLVIHDFWPNYRAGSENATYFLARELAKKHEVTVFTQEPHSDRVGWHEIYRENNFQVIKIHRGKKELSRFSDTYVDEKLDKIFEHYLAKIKPDLVHFQHLITLSLNFIEIAKKNNIPTIFTVHDFWLQCPMIRRYRNNSNCLQNSKKCNKCIKENFIFVNKQKKYRDTWFVNKVLELSTKKYRKRIVCTFLNNFRMRKYLYEKEKRDYISERRTDFIQSVKDIDLFVFPSKFLEKDTNKFGIGKGKSVMVPHGIPIPNTHYKNSRILFDNSVVNFCFMSHIAGEKGFFVLFDVFQKILKRFDNIKLIIYGSYSEEDKKVVKILEKIKKMKNIEYRGVFDNREIGKILSFTDVSVIPSLWQEIYGLVLDESFLCGVPVIVSNRGALPDRVRNGKDGFIFDAERPNQLYSIISTIAKNPRIIENLKNNIPKIKSMETYAHEMEELYNRISKK